MIIVEPEYFLPNWLPQAMELMEYLESERSDEAIGYGLDPLIAVVTLQGEC